MALIKSLTLSNGIVLPNAYIKILSFNGSKSMISFLTQVYESQDSCLAGKDAVGGTNYSFVPLVTDDSANFIKQAYDYLKTLPEFSESLDVLVDPINTGMTLEETKASKLQELSFARFREETGGININGIIIKTDRESQAQLNSALASLKNGFITSTSWKGENGWAEVTLTEIEPIATLVANHVASMFAKEKTLSDQVTAITIIEGQVTEAMAIEEVNAITWQTI